MLRTTFRFALIFLAFWVLGGQWLMLQSVAWANMLRNYSQETKLSKALLNTFDGNHPCPLCRFIQKERSEQENPSKTLVPSPNKSPLCSIVFAALAVIFFIFGKPYFVSVSRLDWNRIPLSPPPKLDHFA